MMLIAFLTLLVVIESSATINISKVQVRLVYWDASYKAEFRPFAGEYLEFAKKEFLFNYLSQPKGLTIKWTKILEKLPEKVNEAEIHIIEFIFYDENGKQYRPVEPQINLNVSEKQFTAEPYDVTVNGAQKSLTYTPNIAAEDRWVIIRFQDTKAY